MGNADEPIGSFEGVLEDMQGRFNLNNLVMPTGAPGVVQPNPEQVERFKRLLRILEMEEKWADLIVDWIDTDTQEGVPFGAEDFSYTGLTPPYRTANMPITRTSELFALPEFTLELYQRLEPFVTALPVGSKVNLCTASPELLDALIEGRQQEFIVGRKTNEELRKQRCFPTLKEFEAALTADQRKEMPGVADEKSPYFRATIWVTIGATQFTQYSLLHRDEQSKNVRPMLRSYGTS